MTSPNILGLTIMLRLYSASNAIPASLELGYVSEHAGTSKRRSACCILLQERRSIARDTHFIISCTIGPSPLHVTKLAVPNVKRATVYCVQTTENWLQATYDGIQRSEKLLCFLEAEGIRSQAPGVLPGDVLLPNNLGACERGLVESTAAALRDKAPKTRCCSSRYNNRFENAQTDNPAGILNLKAGRRYEVLLSS